MLRLQMMRYFRLILGALAMLFVALLFAGITMRIALHGGEVAVPSFSGMSISEASDAALSKHLDLKIDNKFYSTVVPAGRIISQAPAAGSRVRKKWQAGVTGHLGPPPGSIPPIGPPGDPDIVLSQTPPPNAGVDRPQVSLLLSETSDATTNSFVLPSFVGLSYSAAKHAAQALGIRLFYIAATPPPPPQSAAPPAPTPPTSTAPAP